MTTETRDAPAGRMFPLWAGSADLPPERGRSTAAAKRFRYLSARPAGRDVETGTETVEEWLHVPATSPDNYITAGSALNIPNGRGGGDWHNGWRYARRTGEPPRTAHMSADGHPEDSLFRRTARTVLGSEHIVDVRQGLAMLGHPAANRAEPVWGARHERATIEYVLGSVLRPLAPQVGKPEWILDRRTVHRWIPWPDQVEWVEGKLNAVADLIGGARAEITREWIRNAFHNDAPTA